MLQYEIIRRGLYINNITNIIKDIVKNCSLCIIHKLNRFIKPPNIQIISRRPLERIQLDITYFNNKIELEELEDKYLLNFIDHFSKMASCYLIEDKTSETVLSKLKDYIKNFGKSNIIQTDNGGEFRSNIFKLYCLENNINHIFGGVYHPQSQGSIEKFNGTIISKLKLLKLQLKSNFNIEDALNKAVEIYNSTTHSVIKIEPKKAFNIKKNKDINRVIGNMIKSQIENNQNNITIEKGTKALLCSNFILKGNILKVKKLGKKLYEIPIIIEKVVGGSKYSFKVTKNVKNLKKKKLYEANYKLIKFCPISIWEDLNNLI